VPVPLDLDPAVWKRRAPFAALLVALIFGAFFLGRCHPFGDRLPPESSSIVTVQPSPNVIMAVRELARLETTDYHVERVIELADEQVHLFGLVRAKDALLLVAAGDVVAGVDLRKIGDADLVVDWPHRQARVHLPDPEIFSVTIDNARTHVVTRKTDTLATRKEELEGHARSEAESSMRQAALEAGVLPRAKVAAERAIAELFRGLGFEKVTFEGSAGLLEGEETLAPRTDDASSSRSADE
jgi:hypothetical protein